MKKYILKTTLISLVFCVLFVPAFIAYDYLLNRKTFNQNPIYAWGDSQLYRGIDLPLLSSGLNRPIASSASHGEGVYDFLVFTQSIPAESDVIISLSTLMQVRRKGYDRNESGFSLKALATLLESGYSIQEVISIARRNKNPMQKFWPESKIYDSFDTIRITLPVQHFKDYFSEIPSFLSDKQKCITAGLLELKNKKCRVNIIDFPFHPMIYDIHTKSPVKPKVDSLQNEMISMFDLKIDTIKLDRSVNPFHDLSHLNRTGAQQVSQELGQRMAGRPQNSFYVITWSKTEIE